MASLCHLLAIAGLVLAFKHYFGYFAYLDIVVLHHPARIRLRDCRS